MRRRIDAAAYVECSPKTGDGVRGLLEAISRTSLDAFHHNNRFPNRLRRWWFYQGHCVKPWISEGRPVRAIQHAKSG
jgi:hypothetical protein